MDKSDIEFRKMTNSKCTTKCNKKDRKENTDDDICSLTCSELDNLPVRCVGNWAFEKIHYVSRYFNIFSIGMHKKFRTNYIEICSGIGRCINRDIGEEFDGTSLSIINNRGFNYLSKAVFIDIKDEVIDSLNQRIQALQKHDKSIALIGDYEDLNSMNTILDTIPKNCLNLVFIDPTDCSFPFKTIKLLKDKLQKVDFIINFAYGTDLNRNLISAFNNGINVKEKYSNFLGNNSFFSNEVNINYAKQKNLPRLRERFIMNYKENFIKLGYKFFDEMTIRHYYQLLFITSNQKGLEFWKKATAIEADKQGRLF